MPGLSLRPGVFLDTSAWLQVAAPRGQRSLELERAYEGYVRERRPLVTSNLIVAELHALVLRRRGVAAGVALLDHVYADATVRVLFVDRDVQFQALDRWLRRFSDHRISLCDATSFELMRREGVGRAFTIDRHFAVAGFEMLPG